MGRALHEIVSVDKYGIILLVEQSCLPARQALARLDIRKSTFYDWLKRLHEYGIDSLVDQPTATVVWKETGNTSGSDY